MFKPNKYEYLFALPHRDLPFILNTKVKVVLITKVFNGLVGKLVEIYDDYFKVKLTSSFKTTTSNKIKSILIKT